MIVMTLKMSGNLKEKRNKIPSNIRFAFGD